MSDWDPTGDGGFTLVEAQCRSEVYGVDFAEAGLLMPYTCISHISSGKESEIRL